jgi:hypothetical protein
LLHRPLLYLALLLLALPLSLYGLASAFGFGRPLDFGLALLLLRLPSTLGFGRPLGIGLALLLGTLLLLLLLAPALGFGRSLGIGLALPFGLPIRLLLVLSESRQATRRSANQHAHQRRAKWPSHRSLRNTQTLRGNAALRIPPNRPCPPTGGLECIPSMSSRGPRPWPRWRNRHPAGLAGSR